jgi:hypothetical protein
MTGKEGIDRDKFFHLACSAYNARGHSMKLHKPRVSMTRCMNAFSIRVVDNRNDLPQEVVDAISVNCFKNRLDKYWSSDMGA